MTDSTDNPVTRNRFSAPGLLPLLIAVAAGGICYALFWRRGIWLSVVGYSISPAERLLDGEAPYRDFLYNYTPGILWINALLMKLFGESLVTVSGGLFVFKLSSLIALFYLARRVTTRKTAEPVVDADSGSGRCPSGTPVQALPSRAKREPLVTIQLGERWERAAAGL